MVHNKEDTMRNLAFTLAAFLAAPMLIVSPGL
jgi:hypothetical protein